MGLKILILEGTMNIKKTTSSFFTVVLACVILLSSVFVNSISMFAMAEGTVCYVKNLGWGTDNKGTGSLEDPYSTLSYAMTKIKAAGSYPATIKIIGTSAVLNGYDNPAWNRGIDVNGGPLILTSNDGNGILNITQAGNAIFNLNGNDVTLKSMKMDFNKSIGGKTTNNVAFTNYPTTKDFNLTIDNVTFIRQVPMYIRANWDSTAPITSNITVNVNCGEWDSISSARGSYGSTVTGNADFTVKEGATVSVIAPVLGTVGEGVETTSKLIGNSIIKIIGNPSINNLYGSKAVVSGTSTLDLTEWTGTEIPAGWNLDSFDELIGIPEIYLVLSNKTLTANTIISDTNIDLIQWYVSENGLLFNPISGANDKTYTLTATDSDKYFKCEITKKDTTTVASNPLQVGDLNDYKEYYLAPAWDDGGGSGTGEIGSGFSSLRYAVEQVNKKTTGYPAKLIIKSGNLVRANTWSTQPFRRYDGYALSEKANGNVMVTSPDGTGTLSFFNDVGNMSADFFGSKIKFENIILKAENDIVFSSVGNRTENRDVNITAGIGVESSSKAFSIRAANTGNATANVNVSLASGSWKFVSSSATGQVITGNNNITIRDSAVVDTVAAVYGIVGTGEESDSNLVGESIIKITGDPTITNLYGSKAVVSGKSILDLSGWTGIVVPSGWNLDSFDGVIKPIANIRQIGNVLYVDTAMYGSNAKVEWLVSDDGGEYENAECDNNNIYSLKGTDTNKYFKCVITAVGEEPVESNPFRVNSVNITTPTASKNDMLNNIKAQANEYVTLNREASTSKELLDFINSGENEYYAVYSDTASNSFAMVASVGGAKEKGPNGENEVLVKGYNGYVAASIKIISLKDGKIYSSTVFCDILPEMEEIEWSTVVDGNNPDDVVQYEEGKAFADYPKNKIIVDGKNFYNYTGDAEKVILPDYVTYLEDSRLKTNTNDSVANRKGNKAMKILIMPKNLERTMINTVRGNGWCTGDEFGADNLQVVVFGDKLSYFPEYVIGGQRKIKYVSFPKALRRIDANAMLMYASGKDLILPANLQEINPIAFNDGCDNVKEIFIPYTTKITKELNFGGKFKGNIIFTNPETQKGFVNPGFTVAQYAARAKRVVDLLDIDSSMTTYDVLAEIKDYLGPTDLYGLTAEIDGSNIVFTAGNTNLSVNVNTAKVNHDAIDSNSKYMLHLRSTNVEDSTFYKWFALEPGKTYTYSVYHKFETREEQQLHLAYKDAEGNIVQDYNRLDITPDKNYYKVTCEFAVPKSGVLLEGGKVKYQVGIDEGYGGAEGYYYEFKLTEKGSGKNLFDDPYFKNGLSGWVDANGNVCADKAVVAGSKEVVLEKFTTTDFFKRSAPLTILDNDKTVIHNNGTQKYNSFYQIVEAEVGKTYIFEVQYRMRVQNLCSIMLRRGMYNDRIGLSDLTFDSYEYDIETGIYKGTITIGTKNDDEDYIAWPGTTKFANGKVLLAVGVNSGESGADAYFRNLKFYEEDDPDNNLLYNGDLKLGTYGWTYGSNPVYDVDTNATSLGKAFDLVKYNADNFIDDTSDNAFDDGDWAKALGFAPKSDNSDYDYNDYDYNDYDNNDYDETDNYEDSDGNEGTDVTPENNRKKRVVKKIKTIINNPGLPVWLIIVICSGGALLIGTAIFVIIFIKKRKKIKS